MPSSISTGADRRRRCGRAALRQQRRQREDAAFALVVGAHHDRDVLDRDDDQQRVDDQRQHAEHVLVRRRHRVRAEEALAHRVERAGADVAVDDADGGQREREAARRGRAAGSRQKSLQSPTGLADGLEVGSPLPESLRMRPYRVGPPRRRVAAS